MRVLGIETSCDETAASVVGPAGVLSDVVHSQAVHAEFGGVVPELAARAHVEKIGVVVRAALERAGGLRPDAVAATAGPGLIGAVLVGFSAAKALAAGWGVPFIAVNHLEGHLLSPLLDDPAPCFPWSLSWVGRCRRCPLSSGRPCALHSVGDELKRLVFVL